MLAELRLGDRFRPVIVEGDIMRHPLLLGICRVCMHVLVLAKMLCGLGISYYGLQEIVAIVSASLNLFAKIT